MRVSREGRLDAVSARSRARGDSEKNGRREPGHPPCQEIGLTMPINKIESMDGSRPSDPAPDPRRSTAAPAVTRPLAVAADGSRLAPRDVISISSHAVARAETEKFLAILKKRQDVRARRTRDIRARLESGSLLDADAARRAAHGMFAADDAPSEDELREL